MKMKLLNTRMKRHEPVALLGFFLMFAFMFIKSTMIKLPPSLNRIIVYTNYLIVLISISMKKEYGIKEMLLVALSSGVIIIVTGVSDNNQVMLYFLNIISLSDVKKERVAKTALFTGVLLTVITVLLARLGMIEDLTYYQSGDHDSERIRRSMGFIYPTNFAATIFYLLLIVFYLYKGKLNIFNFCLYLYAAYFVKKYCDARLSMIMILLIIAVSFCYTVRKNNHSPSMLMKAGLILSMPIGTVLTYGLLFYYSRGGKTADKLNALLSSRLSIGYRLLNEYGIKPFGQYIEQYGNGGTTDSVVQMHGEYTFIDMSFQRIPQVYGLIAFVVISVFVVYTTKKHIDAGQYLIPVILAIASINSIVDQHFVDFSNNIFLLFLYDKTMKTNKQTYDILRQIRKYAIKA